MKKENLENEVKKIFKQYIKVKFSVNDDLYKKGILDSFDIVSMINKLENKFSLKLNFAKDKKFIFSFNYILKKINSRKKS